MVSGTWISEDFSSGHNADRPLISNTEGLERVRSPRSKPCWRSTEMTGGLAL
jgi:hypothetical protein